MIKNIQVLLAGLCFKLSSWFDNAHKPNKTGFFGLGQFVLLLAITPFIFNLSLYSLIESKEVPSLYEFDPYRFDPLPIYSSTSNEKFLPPKPPSKPTKLTNDEIKALEICANWVKFIFLPNASSVKSACNRIKRKKARYLAKKRAYPEKKAAYEKKLKKHKKLLEEKNAIQTAYTNFQPQLATKPELPPTPEAREYAKRSLIHLMTDHLPSTNWGNSHLLVLFILVFLAIPTLFLSVRWKCWSLLFCLSITLLIPMINYVIFILSLTTSKIDITSLQLNSAIAGQVAFIWFSLKGHLFSRSFWIFILFLSIIASWETLKNNSSNSIIEAQLPILIFIIAAIIARLVVKGFQENAYLFINKGWKNNIKKISHAFILWLPLFFLAYPILYFTSIQIPKSITNSLHTEKILAYPYGHDLLDNSLQSIAIKTDETMYAWHLSMDSLKHEIFMKGDAIQNENLKKRAELTFDQIMPDQLEFSEYQSDKAFVGPAIEVAVEASQDSTNNAFRNLRQKIRKRIGEIVNDHEFVIKETSQNVVSELLENIDDLHTKGVNSILETNRQAQNSAWWTINYTRAIYTLSILLFLFVCIKSYLYVLARISFNRNTGTFVTLGNTESETKPVTSSIKQTGLSYIISADKPQTLYISRRFQCRGKAPNYSIPQPLRSCVSRILNGAFSMNKVVIQNGDDKVSCTATKGIEFFEWELKEGEIVLFDYYHFVGMSESITLSAHISTRASSLLLGKMIHSQAKGPGKLILMAEGRAQINDNHEDNGCLPPERIIASHLDTRFHIDSELDLVNIYLSSAYVRPIGNGQVIVDVDSQRGTKTGLGSFIKRFILPL